MLLKNLELKNIRSHSQSKIDFPDGVVLFEGDVGCGKSTILYAVEFALFGLGDLNASFLLRNSASEGSVKLDFQVNGKEYSAYRSLEKKKTVQQGECYVIENGAKTLYTPSEMKPAILKILGFKEPPNPRSQSIIYRYAVFTPQEEMKDILEEKPEERLQTLRKAFGVEEYRIARDNSGIVTKGLREEAKFLEGQAVDLPKLEEEKSSLDSQASSLESQALMWADKARVAEAKSADAKKRFSEIQSGVAEARSLKNELPLLKSRLDEKKSSLKDFSEQKEFLEKESLDLKQQHSEIKIADVDYSKIQGEYKLVRDKASQITNEIGALQGKQRDYASLKEKGLCPTCGQEIRGDFGEHVSEIASSILGKQDLLKKFKAEEEDLGALLEQAVQQKTLLERKKDLEKRLQKNSSDSELSRQKVSLLEKEIPVLEKTLSEKQTLFASLSGVEEKARGLDAELQSAESEFKTVFSEKTRAETKLQETRLRVSDLAKKILEKQSLKSKLEKTRERKAWLEEHFIPALSAIETHVLAGLNKEFEFLFKKWFMLLVESQDLNVSAGSQFEPVVEISGYEHSYQTLSGGEKSALALAYRLALNVLVKSVSSSMQENLVILDEPTDGFSKEQLSRMREVFRELKAKQILLVSHERELEAFADKVFFVEKKNGESFVKES